MEQGIVEGENPVLLGDRVRTVRFRRVELLGSAALTGGKLHLKLNTGGRPIANKYREGKMQRTLKRELKSA